VKLINTPFKADAIPKAQDLPVWKQDWLIDLVRSGATPAALVLVALIFLFGFVKPALKGTPAQGGKLNVVADNAVALPSGSPPMLEAPRTQEHLATARNVAKENPAAVANIVRGWVKAEE
jgi:flagellar M-ring protein FliF